MWLFLLTLVISSEASFKHEDNSKQRNKRFSELVTSFDKFKRDILKFFRLDYDSIEKRRRKIKKAFFRFYDEAFKDVTPPKRPGGGDVKFLEEGQENISVIENYEAQLENLVKAHGYKIETHTVFTADGYHLSLHRILQPDDSKDEFRSQAVLLHHGLYGSSDDWILLGSQKALPYILLKAQYDVWLTNARGSKHSRGHNNPTIGDDEFWNFSWHEMGQYDLPAVIDYIKDKYEKGVELHFVGHSMGTTALLVLLTIYPRYNRVLKSAVLLAPMAYMYKIRGPLRLLAEFYDKNEQFRKYDSLNFLKSSKSCKSSSLDSLPSEVITKYCLGDKALCSNPLFLFANGGQDIANVSLKDAVQFHSPAGVSEKTIIHYMQQVISGNFQMYNLGQEKNQKKYGTKSPPIYRLNDVTVPIAIFSSADDWLATVPDIESLIPNLQNLIMHHIIKKNDFSHTDFVWSEDAHILIYYIIVDVFNDMAIKN